MASAKLTGPINKINERPNFSTLWYLHRQLVYGLRTVGNFKFPLDGHAGYILLKNSFALFLSKEWRYPEEIGEY